MSQKIRFGALKGAALGGISALALMGSVSAIAAESTGLEEVIVTARKREESVMRTPVVMQVLGQQAIKDMKIKDMTDFITAAPGFGVGRGFGPVGTTVY